MHDIIITRKLICILETKKLNGDITINNQGEFIGTFKNSNGKFIRCIHPFIRIKGM